MIELNEKIERIFNQAIELELKEAREAFVRGACDGDDKLRKGVEELLLAFDDMDDIKFLKTIAEREANKAATLAEVPLSEGPGTIIGRYKLLQQIGEGGMGVVYMAQQTEPVNRKVALKIIKLGMDTKQVVARFEAERQALAMMDHPNIAKVLDGGTTETGRPYFVMELVQGVPITKFCDKNKLSTNERIDLFISVCHAIQSAHQKGIIHRDIKPSNVMISLHHGEPVPKVIDFGIAKATNQKLTEKTLFTNYATMIGTPAYMSPEQAEMSTLDIDTRSDVYSLGVLLYELLTGATPFNSNELLSMGYGEMQRIIAEEDPATPSSRLSTMEREMKTTLAKSRGTSVPALDRLFKGDLDWITMKCLEKDRRRRYDTPNELGADLKRYLNLEPISAAAPTFGYQLRKLYLKKKTLIQVTAVFAVLLLFTAVFSTYQAWKASKAEQKAIEEAAIAKAVNDFLNKDLLGQADPRIQPDRDVKLRTILDRASNSIEDRFPDQPLVEAAIRFVIGKAYYGLREVKLAKPHVEKARELRERELGLGALKTLEAEELSLRLITREFALGGTIREAEAQRELDQGILQRPKKAYQLALQNFGPNARVTQSFQLLQAFIHQAKEEGPAAKKIYADLLERRRQTLGNDHPDTISVLADLALFLDSEEAEEPVTEAISNLKKRSDFEAHILLYNQLNWRLASIYSRAGRLKEALPLQELVAEAYARNLGENNISTLNARENIARSYASQGMYNKSIEIREDQYRRFKETYGANHLGTIFSAHFLARSYADVGRLNDAETVLESALNAELGSNGDLQDTLHYVIDRLVNLYLDSGQFDQVRELLDRFYTPTGISEIEGKTKHFKWFVFETMIKSYGRQGLNDKVGSLATTAIGLLGNSELTLEEYKGKARILYLAEGIQDSLPVYRELTEKFPEDFNGWYMRLMIEAFLGDKEGSSTCIQQMIALDSADPPQKHVILKAAMLIPEGYQLTRTYIESAYKHWHDTVEKDSPVLHVHRIVGLAFVDYRAGRYQNAIDLLACLKDAQNYKFNREGGMGLGLLIKAMSEFQLRNETSAQQALAEAQKNMSHSFPEGSNFERRFPNWDRNEVIYAIVLKEAEAMILGERFPDP